MFLLSNCGNMSSNKNNEYLGQLPSLEKEYAEKISEKEKALKESTDFEDSFKLSKELKILKDERKTKITEYAEANPLTKELPYEPLSGTAYSSKNVVVNKASAGNLNIKIALKINQDIKNKYGGLEKSLFVYYKAVDSKGNDIPKSKTVATNFSREPLVAGLDYEVSGSWTSKAIQNMDDFAKVVEITKEEYSKRDI